MFNKFVVIDTETTGNAPKKGDKMIQIGAVVIENDEITNTISTYIQPFRKIPAFIEQLTGISDKDVKDAPSFAEQAPQLASLLKDAVFIAHNVTFDLHFINEELIQSGYSPFQGPVIDTVELARILYPSAPGYQLTQLAEWLGIHHSRPHQADSDALVTADIWLKIKQKLAGLPALTLKQLYDLSLGLESNIRPLLKTLLQRDESDRGTCQESYEVFHGLAIKRQLEPKQHHPESVEGEEVFFKKTGRLASKWDSFEERRSQSEMAAAVRNAFSDREHALIEAGTGVGKTLSYLVPALYFAKKTQKKVIVSTHTITLQDQLMYKEIPLLMKSLPFMFKSVLLKGRHHYLCLRKLKDLLLTQPGSYEELLGLAQTLIWILETNTGDVEEINIAGGVASSYWEKVKTDETVYLEAFRDWVNKNYYHRAKEQANRSDLIITNHALLFSDLSSNGSILPESKHIVIDEAHHLSDLAAAYLGRSIDHLKMNQVLNKLGFHDTHGLFTRLMMHEQANFQYFTQSWYQRRKDHFALLQYEIDELFRMLTDYCKNSADRRRTEVGRISIRYEPAQLSKVSGIRDFIQRIVILVEEEEEAWEDLINHFSGSHNLSIHLKDIVSEFQSACEKAGAACETLISLLLEEHENEVYWIEADYKGAANAAYLQARPLDVSDILADELFAKRDSVIMTSAALTVKNSFDFVMKEWGLDDFAPTLHQFPSPYNYQEKTKLLVPQDFASIKSSEKEFITETAEFIYHAASITQGKMLVLFTSYHMLKKTYYQLKNWDENGDFTIIGQGVKSGSKSKLIKTFKQNENSILLGTSTFWEGIDIPGEDLSCLIIVRLPFTPPDDPLTEARMEQIIREEKSPFQEVLLPKAVLRFKQGFGRLIRHEEDKGIAVVLDKRMIDTSYGTDFIASIPSLPIVHKPMNELLNEMADFYS